MEGMKRFGSRRSATFGRRTAKALGLMGILGAAWMGGMLKGIDRFGGTSQGVEVAIDALPAITAEAVQETGPVWDLPNLDHPRVDFWVERFTTTRRDEFARYLQRSGTYVPMISAKLEERGMPQDLIYLAMLESGFLPTAYSRAHASGMWQFIAETGRRYGLDINLAVDERNDPVKATDAALDYLTYLYNRFDSWYLAAAGYNTGENRVARIMREVTGSERGDEYSYYRIRERLPRETRDYVPLMVAFARISKEPGEYGFGDVALDPPLAYDEVTVAPATALEVVAQAAGTTLREIRQLNPHFKLNRTRNDMASPVRIPAGTGATFATNWPGMSQNARYVEAPRVRQYRVQRGDNLTVIARRHGVTIGQIRQANGIRGDRIRAGQVLRIPA
jgi:membrane-bound lytic murein transglycosylase D